MYFAQAPASIGRVLLASMAVNWHLRDDDTSTSSLVEYRTRSPVDCSLLSTSLSPHPAHGFSKVWKLGGVATTTEITVSTPYSVYKLG